MTGKSRESFLEGPSEHQLPRGGVGEIFIDRALTFVEFVTVEITLFKHYVIVSQNTPMG